VGSTECALRCRLKIKLHLKLQLYIVCDKKHANFYIKCNMVTVLGEKSVIIVI